MVDSATKALRGRTAQRLSPGQQKGKLMHGGGGGGLGGGGGGEGEVVSWATSKLRIDSELVERTMPPLGVIHTTSFVLLKSTLRAG
jgi:hypothetical protein